MSLNKKTITTLLVVNLSLFSMPLFAASVGFKAVIDTNAASCSVSVPENNLSFKPLQQRDITGSITTYELKSLQLTTTCTEGGNVVTPSLTIQGSTPYSGNNTVFLDGNKNGVGFMLRYIASGVPTLADFYNPTKALDNNITSINLSPLNEGNNYYSEEKLWIGLVGPLDNPVVAGPFSSTIIINMSFQ